MENSSCSLILEKKLQCLTTDCKISIQVDEHLCRSELNAKVWTRKGKELLIPSRGQRQPARVFTVPFSPFSARPRTVASTLAARTQEASQFRSAVVTTAGMAGSATSVGRALNRSQPVRPNQNENWGQQQVLRTKPTLGGPCSS